MNEQRPNQGNIARTNMRSVRLLVIVPVVMFGFGFLMAPLYEVFCQVTGFGGRTAKEAVTVNSTVVDKSRQVTVEFVTSLNKGVAMDFKPAVTRMKVYPGEVNETRFVARNLKQQQVVAQAVHNITPPQSAVYFSKTECFCFTQQMFMPGETKEMPLRFVVSPDLPKDLQTITLSYTFFDITNKTAQLTSN